MPAKRMRSSGSFAFVSALPLAHAYSRHHLHEQHDQCPTFRQSLQRRHAARQSSAPAPAPATTTAMRLDGKRASVTLSRVLGLAASACVLFADPTAVHALSDGQKLVAEAWRIVDQSFVDRTFNNHDWFSVRMKAVKKPYASVDDAYPAIRNMLALLADPYTRFLTPQQFSSLTSTATGELAGVGVEMFPARVDDALTVAEPLDGSPAARAGIRPSDVIRFIDGEPTDGLTPDEAAARIRGRPGTSVILTVLHGSKNGNKSSVNNNSSKAATAATTGKDSDGMAMGASQQQQQQPREETIQLTRENLKLRSVTLRPLENDVLLVRIKQFNSTTADDLKFALADVNVGSKRVVLDLRNNPGGYFPGGVDVARLFMKSQTPIVFVVDKNGISEELDTIGDGSYSDVPLVVLVNKGTASASEILAGALKDNRRAKLVGEKTFGKGVVQTVSQLSDGSGLAVTVARYETPAHKDINKIGIVPDVARSCEMDADVLTCLPDDEAW